MSFKSPFRGNSKEPNDSIDLRQLQSLDPQAVTMIHNRYYGEVYRYASYRLDDSAIAEDVASEVFVILLEAVNRGNGPHSNLRGWLLGTASHLVTDHYRKQYAHPTESLPEDWRLPSDDPSEVAEGKDHLQQVKVAIQKLTPEQQNVLTLRFGNDYSLEETAVIIGKNINAVKAIQFRALTALRRLVEDPARHNRRNGS